MSISVEAPIVMGNIEIKSTQGRGFTPEELADQAVDKIIYVGSQSHPAIREQAEVFKAQIKSVIISYMKQAVASQNTTIANRLTEAGYPELTGLLRN